MIFYFTATGNSFFAVEKLRRNNEPIVSITRSYHDSSYNFDAKNEQSIGFVFPVYFFGLPNIVAKFLRRMELVMPYNAYVYIVMTCGGATGKTGRQARRALAAKGITVNAEFAVKMPDTYIPLFSVPNANKQRQILERAAASLTIIQQQVIRRMNGDLNNCKGMLPGLLSKCIYPRYEKARQTKRFRLANNCNGCGHCAKFCPDKAIVMQEKRPVWVKPSCSLCLACVHRCSRKAIDYGGATRNKERFVNPALKRERYALVK
jgi:Pyruvate/2-oxoacid:ferredoxin oxidoreductase delta subunit